MPRCKKCNDTGVIETGNNDLPCDCPAGDRALFNVVGVKGPVTGAEMRRHFLNGSPEPIETGREDILASDLPGRKTNKHPSHVTRISIDASSFDEKCINCGATDELGGWGKLAEPCPKPLGAGGMAREEYTKKEQEKR